MGSGGTVSLPRPFCNCDNCAKARERGIPWARTGPSLFVEEESILFDTPEEVRLQIEREQIAQIDHVFYTHWHPDHTQGVRIFEHMNFTHPSEPSKKATNIYIPQKDIRAFQGNCPTLFFYEKKGYVKIHTVNDRTPIRIGRVMVSPLDFRRQDRTRYGYLIEEDGKRVVYAPCSVYGLFLDEYYDNLDLLVIEIGWFGDTAQVRSELPKDHVCQDHISFEENLEIIRKIGPKKTILTHIDGTRHLKRDGDHDFLLERTQELAGLNLLVGYDGLRTEI